MPATFTRPIEMVIQRMEVVAVHITAVHMYLSAGVAPSVAVALEGEIVTTAGSPGDATATPPVPPTAPVTERRTLPNVEIVGNALTAVMKAATVKTIAVNDVYAGVRDTLYAHLITAGKIPSTAVLPTGPWKG